VQEKGDLSEVFRILGPPKEALEHRARVPRERRALGVGQPEVEAREHEPEIVAQLRGRVALGTQSEGRDVERPRGRGGLPLQGLESVLDPRPEPIDTNISSTSPSVILSMPSCNTRELSLASAISSRRSEVVITDAASSRHGHAKLRTAYKSCGKPVLIGAGIRIDTRRDE
jgi:hypothetical protein